MQIVMLYARERNVCEYQFFKKCKNKSERKLEAMPRDEEGKPITTLVS